MSKVYLIEFKESKIPFFVDSCGYVGEGFYCSFTVGFWLANHYENRRAAKQQLKDMPIKDNLQITEYDEDKY